MQISPEFLTWLVESRKQNQEVCVKLYALMTPECLENPEQGYEANTLVGMGFSLWRAAFLANKSGERSETNKDVTYFLGEMLETNAITFTQDKKARGFTFNYYLANVRFRLAEYKEDHPEFNVDENLLEKGKLDSMTPRQRWRAFQKAFEEAVNHFEHRTSSSK